MVFSPKSRQILAHAAVCLAGNHDLAVTGEVPLDEFSRGASLAAQWLVGAWWIDSIGSFAIVWLLVKEGREAWSGDECDACCS